MPNQSIPYAETGYYSKLICDYLAETDELKPFYGLFPKLGNFQKQIEAKRISFSTEARSTLVEALNEQYTTYNTSEKTKENIASLAKEETFTVTTGHQLNLFSGPLYFLYKIISVLNLCERLNARFTDNTFVPVFWMASEDHDFEEINYFNLHGKKLSWNKRVSGAVGHISTEGLEDVINVLQKELGKGEHAEYLVKLFSEAYLKHANLAAATRYLANELFGNDGLVIIDGDVETLKRRFSRFVLEELKANKSHKIITQTSQKLTSTGYHEQVHPREINLFYLKEGIRERIVKKDGNYYINDTELVFSETELLDEVKMHPQRFSPNALLRPLYQEVVLPNLCYIGGGGELAYWFQLKAYFDKMEVAFPMLLLRNSVLLVPEKTTQKLSKLGVDIKELFRERQNLENWYTHKLSEIEIDFTQQRNHLKKQFESMYALAENTDASFLGAVAAQEKKQLNGLDKLEKRLLKAQRRKLKDSLERLSRIQEELFPSGSLQERQMNFSEFYEELGPKLISKLKIELDPLHGEFTIIGW